MARASQPRRQEDRVAAVRALAARTGLSETQAGALERLLTALEAEPDPPTRIRAGTEAVEGHLADSLSALEIEGLREAASLADLGAGAGFPGLAIAVALPGAAVDLVESNRR